MNLRRTLTLSVSALVLGAPLLGAPSVIGGLAVANGAVETADMRRAAKEAAAAAKALRKGEAQKAVTHAEAAVTHDPRNSEYRKLLGETYLFAGRFVSAAQALNEALTLDPANGRTALNLALAQIATGAWDAARATLTTHAATIPASDRGLAMALAGDPAGAVALLMEIARQPGADAKTRQNLALSLALAGQWQQARAVASLDLAPDQVDGRMLQWASFARPQNAYDQVASLLGVTPIADNGQPERLALARTMTSAVAAARVADPVEAYVPGPAPVDLAAAVPEATSVDAGLTDIAQGPAITAPSGTQIVFGPRREIVQAIPTRAVRAETSVASVGATKPVRIDVPSTQRFAKGSWYVQLGAYDSVGVARDAWGRMIRRTPQLKALTPASASISTRAGAFQRLSVGGLARADADALCREVRSDGGNCFVRTAAGDRKASWLR